jgi:acyl-coenzyme A thioesterase PaaI-like protein
VSAEARVFTKSDGKLLAHGTSTMMVLQQQLAKN